MAPGGKLLPMVALSLVGATFLVRHKEGEYYPGLFLWTTSRIFAAILSIFLTYTCLVYPFLLSPLRHIPGPQTWNILWGLEPCLFEVPRGERLYQWMENIPNNGLLRFRGFGNIESLVVTSPAALAQVLNTNSYDFIKPPALQNFLALILGWGVLLVEGTAHKVARKNLMPAFHIRHIRDLNGIFWQKSVELIDKLSQESNHDIEFGDWASRVTLDIIGVAGMGHDFRAIQEPNQDVVEKFSSLLDPSPEKLAYFAANMLLPRWFVKALPWNLNNSFEEITVSLNRIARNMVQEKKAKLAGGKERIDKDILSVALESGVFTDDNMVDQLLTFLGAGHETTASGLTWAIYLLTKYSKMQERLRKEIRSKLPSPLTNPEPPTWEQMEELPYLNAVVNETLRYYPTVPLTLRETIRDTEIVGHYIPKGTRLVLVPMGTNRSKQLWGPTANTFDPERWMAPGAYNSGGAANNYANMSFLHGPRSCIGANFAKGEFKVLLAACIGRFEFEMQRSGQIEIGGAITTKPVGGMNVKYKTIEGW